MGRTYSGLWRYDCPDGRSKRQKLVMVGRDPDVTSLVTVKC